MAEVMVRKRTLFRHPLAAIGGSLILVSGFLFVLLFLIDVGSSEDNPYLPLLTFIIVPSIGLVGVLLFLISVWLQVRAARRKGEKVKFNLAIDPYDPAYVRNLRRFLLITAVLIIASAYGGTRAYDATESTEFCGETCHEVMGPQNVTYHNSAHARVACAKCHIGPGASFWVKYKFDGIRQLFATALNTFSRPIETPVHNLRPAQETCEGCHWPRQFYGEKMITHTYYKTDEQNSPWTTKLLMKIGGGNPRTGEVGGIHWHMLSANIVEYIATDPKRENIPWVRLVSMEGDTVIYSDPSEDIPDIDDPATELRKFDCMDCHNRPSHAFLPPAKSINLALSSGSISSDLPYIRQVGLDLLNAEYSTKEEALGTIERELTEYYESNYPGTADSAETLIEQAVDVLKTIYYDSFFPEMHTDYRQRENNLSHFVNDGCFRCHDGMMQNSEGKTISHSCDICHLIIAQGPSEKVEELESDIAGLDFKHPEDIDEMWRDVKCTECHTPDTGY